MKTKKLYLDSVVRQDKKTKGNFALGNYAVELGSWVEKRITDGTISLANSPTINSANITTGTLPAATANRIVDMDFKSLSIVDGNEIIINGVVTNKIVSGTIGSSFSQLQTTSNYAGIQCNGASTFASIGVGNTGQATMYSTNSSYRIGIDAGSIPQIPTTDITPSNLILNPTTGEVYTKALAPYFLSRSAGGFSSSSLPTAFNVQTFLNGLSLPSKTIIQDRFIYYTNTNVASDTIVSVFYYGTDDKVVQVYEARPLTDFTFSVPVTSLTSSNNGDKIGSLALPQRFYINGNINLKSVYVNCVSGVGTANVAIKNYAGTTITSLTVDAAFGGSQTNLGGVSIDTDGFILYVEAVAITGTVEMLSVTISVQ